MPKYLLEHKDLGTVLVNLHPTARKIIARWGEPFLEVTVPKYATDEKILEALDAIAPNLLARRQLRKEVRFHEMQVIEMSGLKVTIILQNDKPDLVLAKQYAPSKIYIGVGRNRDIDDPGTIRSISKGLRTIAQRNAANYLLPRARQLAEIHGCHPTGWKISYGARILGKCDVNGVINISYMTMFLPDELRDYIICHELAHLTEFNHSPRFHQLCDQYVGGREKQLIAQLKAFQWPLLRK
ncbi:MAG: M48 family metallopeptidase [Bacteroidales bacterium]|nr:M48 family metallopeptidase [Bacteroidales bacterium]